MRVKLKDITKFSKGTQINGKNLIDDGAYSYLNGGINPSGKWNEFNVAENTVTISEGGNSSGYVNYMNEAFWCGAHCYYLYDGPKNSKYLYYALKSQQERLFRIRSGACMPNIKKSDLGNFILEYEQDEVRQEEVVKVLEKCELLIEDYKKELDLLDEAVRARFVEMFGDEKKQIIMRDVCSIITDGTHQPPDFKNIGIPFIFVSNIAGDKLTYNVEKYIDQDTYDELIKRTPIEVGDVLLSTVGSYGHAAVVKENKKFLFQRHIAYLKPKSELINSDYLHGAILSPNVQEQIERAIKGIAQKTLNLSEVKKLVIPLPSMEKQNQFASFIEEIDKSRSRIQKSLEASQELFDSLMQEYFG